MRAARSDGRQDFPRGAPGYLASRHQRALHPRLLVRSSRPCSAAVRLRTPHPAHCTVAIYRKRFDRPEQRRRRVIAGINVLAADSDDGARLFQRPEVCIIVGRDLTPTRSGRDPRRTVAVDQMLHHSAVGIPDAVEGHRLQLADADERSCSRTSGRGTLAIGGVAAWCAVGPWRYRIPVDTRRSREFRRVEEVGVAAVLTTRRECDAGTAGRRVVHVHSYPRNRYRISGRARAARQVVREMALVVRRVERLVVPAIREVDVNRQRRFRTRRRRGSWSRWKRSAGSSARAAGSRSTTS